jgi:hypothetical protein
MAFIGRNKTTQPSLYWGESMLQMYWTQVATTMRNATFAYASNQTYGPSNAVFSYTISDMFVVPTELSYYNISYRIIPRDDGYGVRSVRLNGDNETTAMFMANATSLATCRLTGKSLHCNRSRRFGSGAHLAQHSY